MSNFKFDKSAVIFVSDILEPFNDSGSVSPLIKFAHIVDISNNPCKVHFIDSSYFSFPWVY